MDPPDCSNPSVELDRTVETLRPTYAPLAMAMGIAMVAWGLMGLSLNINALWTMSLVGAGLMVWALKNWIHEIVLQWKSVQ